MQTFVVSEESVVRLDAVPSTLRSSVGFTLRGGPAAVVTTPDQLLQTLTETSALYWISRGNYTLTLVRFDTVSVAMWLLTRACRSIRPWIHSSRVLHTHCTLLCDRCALSLAALCVQALRSNCPLRSRYAEIHQPFAVVLNCSV